jgi:hypothetical protein
MIHSVPDIDARINALELEICRLKHLRNTLSACHELPVELIVRTLNLVTHPSALFAFAKVCTKFRNTALSVGEPWTYVDVCDISDVRAYPLLIRRAKGKPLHLTASSAKGVSPSLLVQIETRLGLVGSFEIDLRRGAAAHELLDLCIRALPTMYALHSIVLINDQADHGPGQRYPHNFERLINGLPSTVQSISLEGISIQSFYVNWPHVKSIRMVSCCFQYSLDSVISGLKTAKILESLTLASNQYLNTYNIRHLSLPQRHTSVLMPNLRSVMLNENTEHLAPLISGLPAPFGDLQVAHNDESDIDVQCDPGASWTFVPAANAPVLVRISKWWKDASGGLPLPIGHIEANFLREGDDEVEGIHTLHIEQTLSPSSSDSDSGPVMNYQSRCLIKQPHPYLSRISGLQIQLWDHHKEVYIGRDIDLSLLIGLQHLVIADTKIKRPADSSHRLELHDALEEIWEWLESRKGMGKPLNSIVFKRCDVSMRPYFERIGAAACAQDVQWSET